MFKLSWMAWSSLAVSVCCCRSPAVSRFIDFSLRAQARPRSPPPWADCPSGPPAASRRGWSPIPQHRSGTRSSNRQLWNQGICAASCCTIGRSSYAAAKPLLLDTLLDLPERLRIAARQLRTRRRHGERGPARVSAPARNAGRRAARRDRRRLRRLLPTRHTQAPSGWQRWWHRALRLPAAAGAG